MEIVLEVSLEIYGVYWQSEICGRSALRDEYIERLDYFLLSNSSFAMKLTVSDANVPRSTFHS